MNDPHESDLKPEMFLLAAFSFYEAGRQVNQKLHHHATAVFHSSDVVLFLYYRSIELALKAFLLANGTNVTALRKLYGHKIEELYKSACEFGLNTKAKFNKQDGLICGSESKPYTCKRYEFPEDPWPDSPNIEKLAETCYKILKAADRKVFPDSNTQLDEILLMPPNPNS